MTIADAGPRNGARQNLPTHPDGPPPEPPAADPSEQPPAPTGDLARLSTSELELVEYDLQRRNALMSNIVAAQSNHAFLVPRDDRDRIEDEKAARAVRDLERTEYLRTNRSHYWRQRLQRWQAFWDNRAERLRERLVDPARQLGSVQRTWSACAALMIAILGGALLYLTHTVKLGVVGENGPLVGYFIEPAASAMLVVSMAVQLLGQRSGRAELPRGAFFALDATFCAASMFLATVPYGARYGWDISETLPHLIVPGLVALGVVTWHLCSTTVSELLRSSKSDPALEHNTAILRGGIASGALDPNPSKNRCEQYLREVLGGIGRAEAHRAIRAVLGQ